MRPTCDRSTHWGTRNCYAAARWVLRRIPASDTTVYACDRHVAQLGRELLHGEPGQLTIESLHAEDN